jgi:hypothetical protein
MQNQKCSPRRFLSPVLVAVAIGALLPAGCGKAGSPLPPLRKNPQPVTEVQLAQRGTRVEVSYRVPRTTLDDLPLPVLEIQVRWAAQPGDLKKIGLVQSRKAAPGEVLTDVLTPTPAAGTTVQAHVIALSGRSPSVPSALATLSVVVPPAAPTALRMDVDPAGIRLTWDGGGAAQVPVPPSPTALFAPSPTPPPTPPTPTPTPTRPPIPAPTALSPLAPGAPTPTPVPTPTPAGLRGFLVYRRTPAGTLAKLFDSPTASSSYVDASAKEGDAWCYVVRSVLNLQPLVESADSNEVCLPGAQALLSATPEATELPALQDDAVKE